MIRPILVRAVVTALSVVLALPGAALAAKPIAQFHDHFTESFAEVVCGIPVETEIVVSDNLFLFADDSFKNTSSFRATFTNPENGNSVRVSSAGLVQGTALIDEQAGTVTFVTSYKGLPEKIQTDHGRVLLRDAGVITFMTTFDLASGDFLSSEVIIKGPHPEADSDFVLFCEIFTEAMTA